MAGELIQIAIGTWMLLLGLGYIRLAPSRNPRQLLDPSSPEFRRLVLVGGVCLWIVSLAGLLGSY